MQSAGVSQISAVIPRIDDLVHVIDNFKDDVTKHPAVRSAAVRGLTILNKYYQKSDESCVYRIAMALDPCRKLEYFVEQDWPTTWVNTVKDITRRVYREDYPSIPTTDLPISPKRPSAPSADWPSLLRMSKATSHEERDELTAFWASPCEPVGTDPLQFWVGVSIGRPESRLARMAIDYLSAPASSVEVERAFSRGALTVTHRRHALSDQSARNSIVLGAWLKDTNFIPKDELVEFFQKKTQRERLTSDGDSFNADMSVNSNSL
jgi:hypothetical protein